MKFRDLAYEAYHALSANRMRSVLTILGIVIGISAVIAMTSMVEGLSSSMTSSMGSGQARTVNISAMVDTTKSDFETLAAQMPEYQQIVVTKTGSGDIQYDSKTYTPTTGINGVQPGWFEAMDVKLSSGQFFTQEDDSQAHRVVVVGQGVVKELFGSEDADVLGKQVTVGSDSFTIVGVIKGTTGSSNYGSVVIPLNTMDTRLDSAGQYSGIGIAAQSDPSTDYMSDLAKRTGETFTKILGGTEVDQTVMVYSMSEMLNQVNAIMGGFGLLLGGIAAISLLVGGIGIMNMMLTTVTERIREIGLRKALGARSKDIVRQFLLESVVLTTIGGLIGMVLGFLGAIGLAALVSMLQPTMAFTSSVSIVSVVLAVGVSALIGIVFGYYPAKRAAKLDPIEALRYQ